MSKWNVPEGAPGDVVSALLFAFGQSLERTGTTTDYVVSSKLGDATLRLIFTGTDLTYDAQDRLKSGDVDRCIITVDDFTAAEISGIDAAAKKIGAIDDGYDFLGVLGAISFTGSSTADVGIGWTRDDTLRGGGGSDSLLGGKGDDRLFGDGGDDYLFKTESQDLKDGGDDVFDGGKGFDVAGFFVVADLDLSLSSSKFQTIEKFGSVKLISIEGLYGSSGNDRLEGDKSANLLIGDSGEDTLIGGGGADTLQGDGGKNLLQGGDGRDTATYEGFFNTIGVKVSLAKDGYQNTNYGQDRLVGVEDLIGSDFTDRLIGDGKSNRLSGAGGNDTINGGKGNDTLSGGLGDDLMDGSGGDDALNGRGGADTLIGGGGADRFVFSANDEMGFDTIRGFENFLDRIDLGDLDADTVAAGNQAFVLRGEATTFNGTSGELIWFKTGSTIQVQGDWNADKVADFTIFLETPSQASLTQFDFVL